MRYFLINFYYEVGEENVNRSGFSSITFKGGISKSKWAQEAREYIEKNTGTPWYNIGIAILGFSEFNSEKDYNDYLND